MISSEGQRHAKRPSIFRRLLWHVNRTSLAWLVKAIVTALHSHEKRERRRLVANLEFTPAIRAKAADFNRDGYVVINEFIDLALLQKLSQASSDKMARADKLVTNQTTTHKNFWVRLLDEDIHEGMFASDNLFVRYALQPSVVELISVVLGELPLLVDVLLTASSDSNTGLSYSQLWHRDYDDVRTIKIFTYLTDVSDLGDGPFTFVPRPASAKVGFTMQSHLVDKDIFRVINRSDVRTITGPSFTTFAVETSRCIHMGSRMAPGHKRLMYTATFISAPSVYPSSGKSRFRDTGSLDPTDRLLLGI